MRLLQRLLCMTLTALTAASSVQAQSSSINGPFLGFTSGMGGTAISPIIGIPGASILADSLPLGTGILGTVIAPSQDYAVALRTGDTQIVVIDLLAGQMTPVAAVNPDGLVIAISPSGSAAAVYDSGSGSIQIIVHPRQSPQVIQQFDASGIAGRASAIAVSDDGAVVLAKFVDSGGAGLWMLNSSGAVQRLPVDQPSAVTFFSNRQDAVVSDDATQSARIIMDAGQTAAQVPLVSAIDGMAGFSSIAASEDGGRVFLADAKSGNIATVDVQTGQFVVVPCGCQPAGFYRLKGSSIFSLNEASQQPIRALDASSNQPRIVITPPKTSIISPQMSAMPEAAQ
jgi:hypothetical protein